MGGTTTSTPTMATDMPTGVVNTHAFELQVSILKVLRILKFIIIIIH